MKIYTKTGDQGMTGLYGGKRISKDDLRIEAYGTVDELNTFIGLLACSFKDDVQLLQLNQIQILLFDIGSNLASDPDKNLPVTKVYVTDIETLEHQMDDMDRSLAPLKNFILPGGDIATSYAHVCRTICRRAERRVISLSKEAFVDPLIIQYLNRLSDYFFILSRYISTLHHVSEIPWIPRASKP